MFQYHEVEDSGMRAAHPAVQSGPMHQRHGSVAAGEKASASHELMPSPSSPKDHQ